MSDVAATADTRRHDNKVLCLVSIGHFASHLYMLVLPPLFIFLNQDLGFSYTLLGGLVSARSISTGIAQVPAGFLVDRYGAKLILIGGMLLVVAGYGFMSMASDYWLFLVLVVIGGIGDSVFHPADYAILNGSVAETRIGRAFSIHTFAGHIGFAAAPVTTAFLATLYGWRTALLMMACLGAVIVLLLITQWSSLKDDALGPTVQNKKEDGSPAETTGDHIRLLMSRPLLLLFVFFAISTLGSSGLMNFSIPALYAINGTSAVDVGFALGIFMLVSSFAVLAGGMVADRIERQDRFAAVAYALTVLTMTGIIYFADYYFVMLLFYALTGFAFGVVRPARDMMVRVSAPKGSSGKVFGFIMTGQSVGAAISPLILGVVMDTMAPQWIFYISIFFTATCVGILMIPRASRSMVGAT
jgi:FSR family fosmidomycin resistance protein-like MFS transporter